MNAKEAIEMGKTELNLAILIRNKVKEAHDTALEHDDDKAYEMYSKRLENLNNIVEQKSILLESAKFIHGFFDNQIPMINEENPSGMNIDWEFREIDTDVETAKKIGLEGY